MGATATAPNAQIARNNAESDTRRDVRVVPNNSLLPEAKRMNLSDGRMQ
jgi:hypothetical protein